VFVENEIFVLGTALVILGIFILIAATILASAKRAGKDKTKTAGVIVIGPVPIIFGDKKTAKTLLKLSITLTALLIIAMLIYYFLLG
jgi:uncharacterized protein (TIGR00304 family)